uniref:DUF2207 domain-containing protein n=1 Tax=Candidatus Borrarchaeum sp. TaxID=2846742 RepID=UPI00257AC232
MKKKSHLKLIFIFVIFVPLLTATISNKAYAAGTYDLSGYETTITVNQDASLDISEQITFRFLSGDFGFAYRTIPYRGFDEIKNIQVYGDSSEAYIEASDEEAGTFSVAKGFDEVEITWYYERVYVGSQPVERTFILTYTVTNAISYEDNYDIVDWQAIGSDWDVPIYNVHVQVILPKTYTTEDILIPDKIRSESTVIISENNGKSVVDVYYDSYLPPNTSYEIIVRFPSTVEQPFSWRQYLNRTGWLIGVIFFVIFSGIYAAIYLFRGRDPPVFVNKQAIGLNPPRELHPAIVESLRSEGATMNGVLVTIFYLAKKGYLELWQYGSDSFLRLTDDGYNAIRRKTLPDDLTKIDWHVLRTVSIYEYDKKTRIEVMNPDRFAEALEEIEQELHLQQLLPTTYSATKATYQKFAFFVMAAGFFIVFSLFFFRTVGLALLGTLVLASGLIGIVIGNFMANRTEHGAMMNKEFKFFLRNVKREANRIKKMREPYEAMKYLDEYLPWLFISGLNVSKWIKSCVKRRRYPETGTRRMYWPYWYYYHHPAYGHTYGADSDFSNFTVPQVGAMLDSFAATFDSFVSDISSTLMPSSSGGAGGGG